MSQYIKQLIAEGEHQTLDFKFEINDAKKIARSLSAFANTKGGRLLIGVKDNGKIAGVRSEEEYYMIETAAHLWCRPEVKFKRETWTVEGKTVVEIIVEPSSERPHLAPAKDDKWRAYIRVNDENQMANAVIIKVWKRLGNKNGVYLKFTESEQLLLSHIEQYGTVSFSKACRVAKSNKRQTENILANFIAIGVIEPVFKDNSVFYAFKMLLSEKIIQQNGLHVD